jgi:beta-barrel assembly-enhancing protease
MVVLWPVNKLNLQTLMKKIIFQGIIIVVSFGALYASLRTLNWVEIFKVKQFNNSTEKKLGDMLSRMFLDKEVKKRTVTNTMDSILRRLCEANHIDRDEIKLHVVKRDDINAFALPDKHIVVFTGLIEEAENESELTGVIAHELAHVRLNHVMRKLVKEIGLSVLISAAGGRGGSDVAREAAKLLSSSAYDRKLEKEADMKGVDYMIRANINPEPLADFLFKLAGRQPDISRRLAWISTHPDSKERSEYILEYCSGIKRTDKPILSATTWDALKESVKDY